MIFFTIIRNCKIHTYIKICISSSNFIFFKKFKNQVKPDDVILVNNYDENEKENDRETGEVADSIIRNYDLYRRITEEGEESKKEASDDSSTEKVINEV